MSAVATFDLTARPTSSGLADALANRHWIWRAEPFPHVVADNVFTPATYRQFEAGFDRALTSYFSKHPDTFTLKMSPNPGGPFGLFIRPAWHDLLARAFNIQATGDVDAGLHHHDAGAAGGHVHNDLNPGFFGGEYGPVNLSDERICSYYHGDVRQPGVLPRATVRAVAILYFLCNPPWHRDDGGETGLYRYQDDPIERPAAAIPPINNSLVAFECTPHSYHAFMSTRNARATP